MTFAICDLPEEKINAMLNTGVWNHNCPVKLKDLRLLDVSHFDFDGHQHQGELIVHSKVAESVIIIFQDLYRMQFPIAKMLTIDEFGGNDEKSMKANNSSCFNFRFIVGTDRLSMHSYGLAIDINPVQNPCISNINSFRPLIEPKNSAGFLDRSDMRPGMVENIVDIFKKNDFEVWGGDWNEPKDYHHFQVSQKRLGQIIGSANAN